MLGCAAMTNSPELQVDLADLEDIRKKLPQAEKMLEEKRDLAREAQREADRWAELVVKLRSFSVIKIDEGEPSTGRASPAQDLVVHVIEREDRLMRPAEVTDILLREGHEVASPAAVNAALYAAAEAGRIARPKQRHYGPRRRPPG
jgi:hypothetical protein